LCNYSISFGVHLFPTGFLLASNWAYSHISNPLENKRIASVTASFSSILAYDFKFSFNSSNSKNPFLSVSFAIIINLSKIIEIALSELLSNLFLHSGIPMFQGSPWIDSDYESESESESESCCSVSVFDCSVFVLGCTNLLFFCFVFRLSVSVFDCSVFVLGCTNLFSFCSFFGLSVSVSVSVSDCFDFVSNCSVSDSSVFDSDFTIPLSLCSVSFSGSELCFPEGSDGGIVSVYPVEYLSILTIVTFCSFFGGVPNMPEVGADNWNIEISSSSHLLALNL